MPISILTPERELDVGPRCAQRRDGQEKNGGARKRVIREKHFINASSKGKGRVLLERPPGKTALIRKRGADSLGKRSEERRVGKECRARGEPYHEKKHYE